MVRRISAVQPIPVAMTFEACQVLRLVQIKRHLKMWFYSVDDFRRLPVHADVLRKQKRNACRDANRLTLRPARKTATAGPLFPQPNQPLPQTSPHRDAPENDAD